MSMTLKDARTIYRNPGMFPAADEAEALKIVRAETLAALARYNDGNGVSSGGRVYGDSVYDQARRLEIIARALDGDFRSPQETVNGITIADDYAAAMWRMVRSFFPWVLAALVGIVIFFSAAQAPAKARADLLVFEHHEVMNGVKARGYEK